MAKPLRSHRDLAVYQAARAAAKRVFEMTLRFPVEEKYALVQQSRNSARSVGGAIAEAFRKRRYPNHWISKLSDGESEAAETQVWIETALDCGYITTEEFEVELDAYDKIIAQLVIMAAHPEKWCVPTEKRSP